MIQEDFGESEDGEHFDEARHMDKASISQTYTVHQSDVGLRLDKLASQVFVDFSRENLKNYIVGGQLTLNGAQVKPKIAVKLGDVLTLNATLQNHSVAVAQNIALDVVYEDDSVLVINKSAGMVVHPAAGHWTGTLVNALLFHYPQNAHLPRAGLVHRIDKDTTGLLLVAKTAKAQLALIDQLKAKTVYRHYQCVVLGTKFELLRHTVINAPIGRHPTQRTKMAVVAHGKEAITHLMHITELYSCGGLNYCLLDVALQTGRTHQIRVHLSSLGHGLVGDKTYTSPIKGKLSMQQKTAIAQFPRQALHAYQLGFVHPETGKTIKVTTDMPQDMQELIAVLDS